MTTAHDRITAALEHRTLDRIPICESGIWPETIARWEQEGLPRGADPIDFFKMDRISSGGSFDVSFFPHTIYEDDGEYVTDLNGYGTVVKWRKKRSSSEGHMELEHKVTSMGDWREARQRLTVDEARLRPASASHPGDFITLGAVDHFWMSFCMCGFENLCCWLVDAPDDVRSIYEDYVDFLLGMLDLCVAKGMAFDGVWFFTDMAYHSGPMFSPATYREVIEPGYLRLREWCDRHGKWMLLHCDGNLDVLLPELIRTGFDWIHPLEARAGNDVRRLKPLYGDAIAFMGNINADVLARGDRVEIEDEIAGKITAAKPNGGYVYNIDHSVPPTVNFETYTFAMDLVRRYGAY